MMAGDREMLILLGETPVYDPTDRELVRLVARGYYSPSVPVRRGAVLYATEKRTKALRGDQGGDYEGRSPRPYGPGSPWQR